MKPNPVGWFEIYVNDMKRARKFYESVFGGELRNLVAEPGLEMFAFASDMKNYGAAGALVKMEGCAAGGNSTIVYFSCDDCAIEEKKIRNCRR